MFTNGFTAFSFFLLHEQHIFTFKLNYCTVYKKADAVVIGLHILLTFEAMVE